MRNATGPFKGGKPWRFGSDVGFAMPALPLSDFELSSCDDDDDSLGYGDCDYGHGSYDDA